VQSQSGPVSEVINVAFVVRNSVEATCREAITLNTNFKYVGADDSVNVQCALYTSDNFYYSCHNKRSVNFVNSNFVKTVFWVLFWLSKS